MARVKYTEQEAEKLNIAYPSPPTKYFKARVTKEQIAQRLELEDLQEMARCKAKPIFIGDRISDPLNGLVTVKVKPMSTNEAWRGRRFKSPSYLNYQKRVTSLLPPMEIAATKLKLFIEFGFSSKGSDIDNGVKQAGDILSKFYGYNDNQIYEMNLRKVIVPKGSEYFAFRIETL